MIGILSRKKQAEIVLEFFQLFKTPWEFHDNNKYYDVVIITENNFSMPNAKLVLVYGSDKKSFDSREGIEIQPNNQNILLQYENIEIPAYGSTSAVNGKGCSFLQIKDESKFIGLEIEKADQKIIRIGYDLFDEVAFLLSVGQPSENACIPSLEIHISIMRNCILNTGIPLVEIPPVPEGHNFIVCLTHDIDFIRIRDHKFDHTMWGFLYRATIGTFFNVLKGKRKWEILRQNLKAVLALPFVYLGLLSDFWFQFDRYAEIEKDAPSTFFLIPFKNKAGSKVSCRRAKRRAAKYDIVDIQDEAKALIRQGFDIGVHGIDAWHDAESARNEFCRIAEIIDRSDIGIRIHWLCFDQDTPRVLEEAGFLYDSTFGYNEAVGYRAGSSQLFKPIGVKKILELPLHIQDTALFNPQRMDLSESHAWNLCNELIEKYLSYGGVLTILWHDRSLAPERLYENFYIRILEQLKSHGVWFATASQAVAWYLKRRSITFEKAQFEDKILQLKLRYNDGDIHPRLLLRIHHPGFLKSEVSNDICQTKKYMDIPLTGETDMEIDLQILKTEIY
jgi:hypothetical protein